MGESDKNEIYLSSSPHFLTNKTTDKLMLSVLVALLPETIYGILLYGLPALITILVSVVSAVFFEALFQKLTRQKITVRDYSAAVTGLLFALVLPPAAPVWEILLGTAFAIIIAKAFFGGLGSNVFNPALAGRAFLFISFPADMTAWIKPGTDAVSSATVLSAIKAGTYYRNPLVYMDYFIGHRAGCIGESSILLILISFLFLLITRVIDWKTPLAMVATVAAATFIAGGDVVMAVMAGGLLFGAVFMATDYATTPVTAKGRVIFGIGAGLITFLIRKFGGYPEGVMFSILIMNAFSSFLDNLTPRKYGYGKKITGAKK
jgi:electron transport complex protein RnfD